MPVSKNFQDRLNQLISEADKTRTELRKLIGVSPNAFTNAVVYGIIPTPKTLVRFADYFDVSLEYLLGKSDFTDFTPSTKGEAFYKRFEQLCKEKQVTHNRVSEQCGFDNCLIVRWRQKGFTPSFEILELLCAYFHVSPDYLLGRSDFRD